MKERKAGCIYVLIVAAGFICFLALAAFTGLLGAGIKEDLQAGFKENREIPFQKVEMPEDRFSDKYYYQQLKEEERTVYMEIAQGVFDHVEEIYVHSSDADATNLIFQHVLKDFPEIFWCDGTTKSIVYQGEESYTVLEPLYNYSREEKERMKAEIEKGAAECLAGADSMAADYDKILYVYEYIVNTVDYDASASDNQNIYSVFANKKSVCAGYSKATQFLLERLGVFCTYVMGTTKEGQNHAWNLVKCEGEYYYVDSTWGDPVFQGEDAEVEQDYISYDYMCCNDEELLKTHTPDQSMPLPECTEMEFNYYVVNGMFYEEYDGDRVRKTMDDVIAAKGNPVVLKFSSEEAYEEAYRDVFENQIKRAAQNLAERYGLSQVKYRYLDDPELYKITVYWQYE